MYEENAGQSMTAQNRNSDGQGHCTLHARILISKYSYEHISHTVESLHTNWNKRNLVSGRRGVFIPSYVSSVDCWVFWIG